ncbi:MAG: SlyX family protein [Zetaproteobacteria bacterium]|nr:SlyX family protein [Zetaproteobacteria bacterium]
MNSLELRVVELESKISFQDHTIGELNEVITDQQKMIDSILKRIKQLEQNAQQSTEIRKPHEELPPPHY